MRASAVAIACLLAVVPAAGGGCGGGDGKHNSETSGQAADRVGAAGGEAAGGENEAADRGRALAQLPPADRTAYFQLAVSAGLTNRAVSGIAVSAPQTRGRPPALAPVRQRVTMLRPVDPNLAALRTRLLTTIDAAMRAEQAHRFTSRSARALVAKIEAIVRGLKVYAGTHPGVSALVPD